MRTTRNASRPPITLFAWLCVTALCACATARRAPQATSTTERQSLQAPHGNVHDFDFLIGEWEMSNRRLAHRGVGSHEWLEFPSHLRNAQYLSGLVNVDEIQYPRGISGKNEPYSGLAVRTFDVQKQTWSIYWVSGKRGCCLTDPVEGGFVGDRGEFYGTDSDDGRPVKVRFVWTKIGPDTFHWDQSFDYGDGTWEMNWENTLKRRR